MNPASIILTGPMGAGKTTVGKILAEKLKWPFIDTDSYIENRLGCSISSLFQNNQTYLFREEERKACEALEQLCRQSPHVIATGGGTLVPSENRLVFKNHFLCCLKAAPDVLSERIASSSRPLAPYIGTLLKERAFAYNSIFHQFSTDSLAPAAISDCIEKRYHIEKKLVSPPQTSVLFIQTPSGCKIPTIIKENTVESLPLWLKWLGFEQERFTFLVDANLAAQLKQKLPANFKYRLIPVNALENNKTLEQAELLYKQLAEIGHNRRDPIIAVGGGVVLDLAGFVAGTYHRGTELINIPTTLLAMVDAAHGGKNGVNSAFGKNQIGTFLFPKAVLVDPSWLSTLPFEQMRCGMAELIKHAIIDAPQLFEALENSVPYGQLGSWLEPAIRVKLRILEEDPYEQNGKRMVLNLGHSIGHALEKLSHYQLLHGDAVAMGIAAEARFARKLERCSHETVRRLVAVLKAYGLPAEIPPVYSKEAIENALKNDKKNTSSSFVMALPQAIGKVETVHLRQPLKELW